MCYSLPVQFVEERKTPSVLGPSVMTEKKKGGPLPLLVAKEYKAVNLFTTTQALKNNKNQNQARSSIYILYAQVQQPWNRCSNTTEIIFFSECLVGNDLVTGSNSFTASNNNLSICLACQAYPSCWSCYSAEAVPSLCLCLYCTWSVTELTSHLLCRMSRCGSFLWLRWVRGKKKKGK